MITRFNKFNDRLFELFEQTNIYDFELFKVNNKVYEKNNWPYKEYVYRFKDKVGDFYYVRLSFVNNNTETEKNFLSIDFMEEETYQIYKDAEFDARIDYKNTNKNEAIKIINTVFKIVSDFVSEKKPWIVCFVSNDERYKTYEYIINKVLNKFILISYYDDRDSEYKYYLYNNLYYYVSENGLDIVRKDNDFVVYSANTESNNPDEFNETSEGVKWYRHGKFSEEEKAKDDQDDCDHIYDNSKLTRILDPVDFSTLSFVIKSECIYCGKVKIEKIKKKT